MYYDILKYNPQSNFIGCMQNIPYDNSLIQQAYSVDHKK